MRTNTIQNFAKRLAMVLAVGFMAVNALGVNWNKVANLSEISNGDSVIVVIQDGKTLTSGKAFIITGTTTANSTDVTITSNSYISNPGNNIKWAMTKSSDTYTFKNGSVYLSSGSETNANTNAVSNNDYNNWYITKLSDGYFKVQITSSSGRYLSWKGSCFGKYTDNFRNQISTGTALAQYDGAISFYKKESGYAVTYNNGGHGTAPSNTSATSVTLSAITATGYTCTGWKANVAVTNTSTSASISAGTLIPNSTNVTLSGATTFTAQWSANEYTVTLNDNTGSGGSGSKTVTFNANTNLTSSVTVPSKAHHDFAGYWTSSDAGSTFDTKLVNADGSWVASITNYTDASKNWIKADDVTLYAKWTEHGLTNYRTVCSSTYNVTYDGNGNTDGSVPTDNTDYDSGDEVTVLGNSGSLVKTHYAFDGWNTKADGSGYPYAEDETFEITKNTTLYAQWACDENITISAGTPTNGSFTLSSTGDVETCSDDVVITVTPSPNTGYNFSAITQTGLNSGVTINQSDKTVTYDQYSSGTTTINVTFVAKTTTVTLNKNGATSGTNQTVSATYGLAMPTTTTASTDLVAPTKNGYTLLGYWDTDATTGGKQYYDANMTSVTSWDKEDATVTLYARWKAKVDRFIDDMHETTGYTSDSPHEESGASYTMPGPLSNTTPGGDCVTAHYIFVGWVLSTGQNSNGTLKDSGSRIYRPGETIHATNATYYAVWAEE